MSIDLYLHRPTPMLRSSLALLAMLQPAPQVGAVLPPPPPVPPIPLKAVIKQVELAPLTHIEPLPFPVEPYGTYANSYAEANCTAYVASRKQIPNSWGNASTWAVRASEAGIVVSDIPIVGSIAQSSRGGYGHVAIVVATAPGQILLDEQNYDYHGSIREDWQPTARYTYIYV